MEPKTDSANPTVRESPLHPDVRLERRLPPFYAAFFYAFPLAIAWIWLYHVNPKRSVQLWAPADSPRSIAIGAAAGLLIAADDRLFCRRLVSGCPGSRALLLPGGGLRGGAV